MTKTELQVIRNVIKRLKHFERASDEIKAHMNDPKMKSWMDAWVITPLEIVQEEGRDAHARRYDMNTALGLSQ